MLVALYNVILRYYNIFKVAIVICIFCVIYWPEDKQISGRNL